MAQAAPFCSEIMRGPFSEKRCIRVIAVAVDSAVRSCTLGGSDTVIRLGSSAKNDFSAALGPVMAAA